jgi:tyrosyl-tRNA synthetase
VAQQDSVIAGLRARGLLAQCSDEAKLIEHLQGSPRTLYCGFDPTADSLHIGNLVPLLALRRFQRAGHTPILLVGGATGMIGDPSFKSAERNFNEASVVAAWTERIRVQVSQFFDFDGPNAAVLVNNYDWSVKMNVLEYLRDIGKHFSVNAMSQRDSVKNRLEREGEGISYTEFSYVLLQSMDYLHLAKTYNCSLQIGGSDQWGNIVSGVDLVRRKLQKEVFAATLPLVTKADGTKFGKTAGGAVWLDSAKTSPYSFYQFWLNTADADAINFLHTFSFMVAAEIEGLAEDLAADASKRQAQKALAREVTELVHGQAAVVAAERISGALFAGELASLTEADLAQLELDGMDSSRISGDRLGLLRVMAQVGVAPSNGAARKLVSSGGVRLNGQQIKDPEATLSWADGLFGRYHLLRRGKKTWHLLVKGD